MSSWNSLPFMSSDNISVEANSDSFYADLNLYSPTFADLVDSIFGSESIPFECNIAGVCDSQNLIEAINPCVDINDFDKYIEQSVVSNPTLESYQNLLLADDLPFHTNDQNENVNSHKEPIFLSTSVDVGVPQRSSQCSHKIEIVHELEEKFRPRYKSDYFAQNGTKRKPRYVADRFGNHYIMLRVPIGISGQIQVDWVTLPDESNARYYMPYKFQVDNESTGILDRNPILLDIKSDSPGIMKVYLVLIKAKQDALKSLQPLERFRPRRDNFEKDDKQTSENLPKLTPKQLIKKYKLARSQLAFTFCTSDLDGSPLPEWDTTIYSTILEEETTDSSQEKVVNCPQCLCAININDGVLVDEETVVVERKNCKRKNKKSNPIKKQRSLNG
ncbi:unnamed protein product [Rotaria socialis]|uniref:Uncharacterized protein n=1 Tax=Rotaria socialis TaxID=392032 RepID=A0A818PK46_9BILA|nr:unnamed protein product [Rotaria socialis]CAF3622127.1 unnamed protein product [Rotaria socialis]CAF3633509.1 unnamed protein product [Rotaria socialis]CAF3763262.1 unnamed protein product [Rotaria socialis]CAF4268508.1 unnamed protein product [Rotaria socialis]